MQTPAVARPWKPLMLSVECCVVLRCGRCCPHTTRSPKAALRPTTKHPPLPHGIHVACGVHSLQHPPHTRLLRTGWTRRSSLW